MGALVEAEQRQAQTEEMKTLTAAGAKALAALEVSWTDLMALLGMMASLN